MGNKKAWDELKAKGLVVDAQVYGDTGYVGFVNKNDKSRSFVHPNGYAQRDFPNSSEARRDSNALARAISRETGIPLHPSVPPERLKQCPSQTKDAARLQAEHEMDTREAEEDFDESPKGRLYYTITFFVLLLLCLVLVAALWWLGRQ